MKSKILALIAALFLGFAVAACEQKFPDLNVGGGNDSPAGSPAPAAE